MFPTLQDWQSRRPRLARAALIAALVALLGFSWRGSTQIHASDADTYESTLRDLDRALLIVNTEVLRARFGLALHYDEITTAATHAREVFQALAPPPALRAEDQVALATAVERYRSLVERHLERVEKFKRDNSQLRNSVQVVPKLLADLGSEHEHLPDEAVRALLQLDASPGDAARANLRRAANRIRDNEEGGATDASAPATLRAHLLRIADTSAEVDEELAAFSDNDIFVARDAVKAAFNQGFAHLEIRQDAFRVVLLLSSIALLIGIVIVVQQLRRAMGSLNVANRTLEEQVEKRSAEASERSQRMRLVLDHVTQGLVVVNRDGSIEPEQSKAFLKITDGWRPKAFADWMATVDAGAASWLRVSWPDLFNNEMPIAVLLDQLPLFIADDERSFDLSYHPIMTERGEVDRILIVISDASDRVRRERSEREGRDLLSIFELSAGDIGFLRQALAEVDLLTETAHDQRTPFDVRMRALHTLKGLWRMIGAFGTAEQCHYVEQVVADAGDHIMPRAELGALTEAWQRLRDKITPIIAESDVVTLTPSEIETLHDHAAHLSRRALQLRLRGLVDDPADRVLSRYAHETLSLSLRMRKEVNVVVTAEDVRLPRRLRPVWPRLVHVVRNAVDHGIDVPAARRAAGKPERGRVEIIARDERDALIVEVRDDGNGIDWALLRKICSERGIAVDSDVDALFADGISTKTEVTEVSGRGLGMADVRDTVREHGGTIEVLSSSAGTTVRLRFPHDEVRAGDSDGGDGDDGGADVVENARAADAHTGGDVHADAHAHGVQVPLFS